MIIPSIDISDGETVQLVGGDALALRAGDPRAWLERFSMAGEVAVVDLDAARGQGSNRELIRELCRGGPCRVGGGIRDLATAIAWLDAGAARIVIGTAAAPDLLRELPRERVIVALDAREGEVVVEGWTRRTGQRVEDRLHELRELVGGFLVTLVEREGRLGGTDLERARRLVAAAGPARLTLAGGITTAEEVAALDRIGVDAQVGMALYTDRLDLADAIIAPISSDRPDGLVPTVVVSATNEALGLAWSSRESLREAIHRREGVYQSRKRGLWRKGATSGATQRLLRVDPDCDRDALRLVVEQSGTGFCHLGSLTCWGAGSPLGALQRTVSDRRNAAPAGSYTRRLLDDPVLLGAKLREEAAELAAADSPAAILSEAADLCYFLLVRLVAAGYDLDALECELAHRALRLSRRAGDAKPPGLPVEGIA